MKSAIIFYSFSGNTRKVAQILKDELSKRGSADLIDIQPLDESKNFFCQATRAFFKKRAMIKDEKLDLTGIDLICIGTPVWAFGPAPAINTYIDKCFGLVGKEVILFTTYGSGTGNQRCLNYMQVVLSKKGAKSFNIFSIQQFKVDNKEFVLSKIREKTRLPPYRFTA